MINLKILVSVAPQILLTEHYKAYAMRKKMFNYVEYTVIFKCQEDKIASNFCYPKMNGLFCRIVRNIILFHVPKELSCSFSVLVRC